MATFALIHGAGDARWYWRLVAPELRRRGHDVVAPDLPCNDDSAGLWGYADTVAEAVGDRRDLVVVAQSSGGFTAPLVLHARPYRAARSRRRPRSHPGRGSPRLVDDYRLRAASRRVVG
jgi:pimeloyl-ACP methyl ester carboxylesterase